MSETNKIPPIRPSLKVSLPIELYYKWLRRSQQESLSLPPFVSKPEFDSNNGSNEKSAHKRKPENNNNDEEMLQIKKKRQRADVEKQATLESLNDRCEDE